MIKPIGTGERSDEGTFYRLCDLDELPQGANCVTTLWRFSMWDRLCILFFGVLWISFKSRSIPYMRVASSDSRKD